MTSELKSTSGAGQALTPLTVTTAQPTAEGIQCLPEEILLHIFTDLTAPETLAARLVCRKWDQLMEDSSLWRFFLGRDFQISETDNPKEVYRRNYCTNPNLTHGIYSTTAVQITKNIVCQHACFKDGKFIIPNYDGDIEIWDLKNGTLLNVFKNQHDGVVSSLIVTEKGQVIAGYVKGKIQLWDLQTGKREHAFICPAKSRARHLISENEKTLIWIDDHSNVTICDLETLKCVQTFRLNMSRGYPIQSIIMTKEGNFITGEQCGKIRVWNREGSCIKTLDSCGWVGALVLTKDGKLISRYQSNVSIKIWNLESGECEMPMEEGRTSSCSLFLSELETVLISGSDETVKFWDLATGTCVHSLEANLNRNSRVLFTEDEQLVLCFSYSGAVKVLNFRASNNEIFEELAALFEGDVKGHELAMERFLKMPERERGQIYVELYKILKKREEGFSGSAAHAFHDLDGLSSTPAEKAEAIRNYLNRESKQ